MTPISNSEVSVLGNAESGNRNRQIPGSMAFVPSTVGMIVAGEVIRDLLESE